MELFQIGLPITVIAKISTQQEYITGANHTLCASLNSHPGQPLSTLMLQTESPGQRGEEKQMMQTTTTKTGVSPDI